MMMTASIQACDAAYAAHGEAIFQQCDACHSAQQGVTIFGPSLYGVIGRPAGSMPGYPYSRAMQEAAAKGLVWTPDKVKAYLVNPRKYLDDVAGDPDAPNKMPFSLSDPADRDDVVAYLQGVK